MIAFRQFLNKYGILLLPVSIKSMEPGAILRKEKRGYYPFTSMREVLADSSSKWNVHLEDANIVQEKVSRTLSLKGKYSLKTMGVDIGGGLSKAKSATYTISGVKAKILKNASTMYVEQQLDHIKSNDRRTWKRIKGKAFVELTFYATEFTIDFDVDANANIKADVGQKITHGAGADIKWTTKTRIKVTSNDAIPFGFKRLRIR